MISALRQGEKKKKKSNQIKVRRQAAFPMLSTVHPFLFIDSFHAGLCEKPKESNRAGGASFSCVFLVATPDTGRLLKISGLS